MFFESTPYHGVILPLPLHPSPPLSTPPHPSPPQKKKKKKKRKLSDFTKNYFKCRIKIENSTLRIFEKFKFLQKQDVYTQSLYFWSFFDTPVSPTSPPTPPTEDGWNWKQ